MLISYTIPSYCVHVDYDLTSVNRLLYILFIFITIICFLMLSAIISIFMSEVFIEYDLFSNEISVAGKYSCLYEIYFGKFYLFLAFVLIIVVIFIIYFDIYYFSKSFVWICIFELFIFFIMSICRIIIGYLIYQTKSYQILFENSLYLDLKEYSYKNDKLSYNSHHNKLNIRFAELIRKINNNPPEISEIYMKKLETLTYDREIRESQEVTDGFVKLLSKTDAVITVALLFEIILLLLLHYVLFKYFFIYDFTIFAARENDSWKLDSIKIDSLKDGKYMLYIDNDDIYFVEQIDKKGYFMQITVEDHQIVNCVCYHSGKKVKWINLGGDENLYGFDKDGNAVIDESVFVNTKSTTDFFDIPVDTFIDNNVNLCIYSDYEDYDIYLYVLSVIFALVFMLFVFIYVPIVKGSMLYKLFGTYEYNLTKYVYGQIPSYWGKYNNWIIRCLFVCSCVSLLINYYCNFNIYYKFSFSVDLMIKELVLLLLIISCVKIIDFVLRRIFFTEEFRDNYDSFYRIDGFVIDGFITNKKMSKGIMHDLCSNNHMRVKELKEKLRLTKLKIYEFWNKTRSMRIFSSLLIILMCIFAYYWEYEYSYDISIYADRTNDSWNFESMCIDVAKDGRYILYITDNDIYCVDQIMFKGSCVEIFVENHKICNFQYYKDENLVDCISLNGKDCYAFDKE